MEINGVNLDDLTPVTRESLLPDVVEGRVLQLDGDCLAYECAAFDDDPFNKCVANFKAALQQRMALSGSTKCVIHMTTGNKGGRYDTAMVKEYQANRKGKVKPIHLSPLKEYVTKMYQTGDILAINHPDQEADDGMAQGNYAAIKRGERDLSVIMSMDKDLTMCSGLHCDWHTYQIKDVDGFGSIYLDDSGSSKKIKGHGTSFFWAQLLMGDPTDGIPGLPKLGMPLLDKVDPLKNPRKENAKPKACGAVMAYKILSEITSDTDAFLTCIQAYQSYYGKEPFEFTDWRGDTYTMTSGHMLLEQAKLLWMRREKDECPSIFFKQVMDNRKWDGGVNEG